MLSGVRKKKNTVAAMARRMKKPRNTTPKITASVIRAPSRTAVLQPLLHDDPRLHEGHVAVHELDDHFGIDGRRRQFTTTQIGLRRPLRTKFVSLAVKLQGDSSR